MNQFAILNNCKTSNKLVLGQVMALRYVWILKGRKKRISDIKTSKQTKNALNKEPNISLASQSVSSHPFFSYIIILALLHFLSTSSHPLLILLLLFFRYTIGFLLSVIQQSVSSLLPSCTETQSSYLCYTHCAIFQIVIYLILKKLIAYMPLL